MASISFPTETTPHKCNPPVHGGFRMGMIDLLNAATPWDKSGPIPMGTIWTCTCGRTFWAHKFAPLLPGWDRIPKWLARRIIQKREQNG